MKIALVKRRYSLCHGGSERYCVNLARGLEKAGHHVTVIGTVIDADLKDEIEFRRVSVNRISSWTDNRSFAVNAGNIAKEGRFDIVYGLGRSFGLDAVRITERLQSHWVNVHYNPFLSRPLQKWNPRHRTLISLEKAIYQAESLRRIVTQSKLDRQLLSQYYGETPASVETVYNGVDLDLFHPRIQDSQHEVRKLLQISVNEILLIFASMDFAGKGLKTILQAISLLKDSGIHLAVLGNGPVRKFQKCARHLGIENKIHFLGRRSDIQRFYGAGALFVLPTTYEPFPNVILEAMACELPAITTKTNGSAEIIEHKKNGYLIETINDVKGICHAIGHHLHQNASDQEAMRKQCRKTAERFPFQKNLDQTLQMFEDIYREKSRN